MSFIVHARRSLLAGSMALLVACSSGEARQAQYLERAREHYSTGNFDKAMVETKNVLQINSNNVEGRYLLAQLHEREQNWQQMFANLQLVVDLDGEHIPARIKLGQMFYANAMYPEALAQADAVLALEAGNADAHTLRGSVLFREGKHAEAIEEASLALQNDPDNVGAISVFSAVYGEKDPERALAVIGDGITRQTKNATLKLLKIEVLEHGERHDEALAVYRELVEEYPDNLFFRYRMVRYLEQNGRTDEAEAALREIVNTTPDNVDLKLWLAQFLANNRDPQIAEATLKGFIEKQPKLYELRFALGTLYAAQQQFEPAIAVYREVVTLDGKGADALLARNRMAEIALARNDSATAQQLLDEVFAIEPENSEGLITRARIALQGRDTKTATADLRTVLRNEPDNVVALRLLASAHEADGALNLALDNYRQILGVAPADRDAAYHAARLALAQGETENAERALLALVEQDPEYLDAQRLLAATLSKGGKWEVALARVQKLVDEPRTRVLGLYLRGRIAFDREDFATAATSMEEALAAEPALIEALGFAVMARERLGERDQALAYVQAHVAAHPDHAHALDLLGEMQQARGNTAAAREAWTRASAVAPEASGPYLRLAGLDSAARDFDSAEAVLRRGLEQAPESVELQVALGSLLVDRGQVEPAMAAFEDVLERHPNMAIAANNLAALIADHSSDEEALRRALALVEPLESTQQPAFLDTLAWVNYRLGNHARAVNLSTAAIQLGGKAPVFHYHLGMAYHRQNQAERAREHLELALADPAARFPGRDEAKATLDTL